MPVTRHLDLDAFIAAVAPMSARGEASASIFTGAAHALKRTPAHADERVHLATCHDAAGFGAIVQRDDGPALIGASDASASIELATDLANDFPALQGVMGAPAACDAFMRRWTELTGRMPELRVRLRQHMLTAVNDVPLANGRPRVAVAADTPWLIEMQIAFIAEVGIHDRPERVKKFMPLRVARGDYWIWDDGGRVAYAAYNDAAPDFARIAPVHTVAECRGRGYATALVAHVSRELLSRGKRKLFLTTDVANPTSNAIYARIGFRPENEDCGYDFVGPGA